MLARAATQLTPTRARVSAYPAAASLALAAFAAACADDRAAEADVDAAGAGNAFSDLAEQGLEEIRAAMAADAEDEAANANSEGEELGEFSFTYYVIAREPDPNPETDAPAQAEPEEGQVGVDVAAVVEADDEELPLSADAVGSEASTVAIHDDSCEPIAEVAPEFARDLRMQGTGVLRDGRLVTASRRCDCDAGGVCFALPSERYRWGIGAANRTLSPFRSVAVDTDVVALGQTLYVPELDGLRMPGKAPWGGFVHDGCVVADDRGGNVKGKHLDFFAARRGYYRALQRKHGITSVTVYDGSGRCDELAEGRRPAS